MVEKKVGDTVVVQLPGGTRKLRILELVTFHQLGAQ
jgi:transcription elongation GreA/GreB family factor